MLGQAELSNMALVPILANTWLVLEWSAWILVAIFALVWISGCRYYASHGGIVSITLTQTMFLCALAAVFPFTGWNKLHILWAAPVAFASVYFLILIPGLNTIIGVLTGLFGLLVCGKPLRNHLEAEGQIPASDTEASGGGGKALVRPLHVAAAVGDVALVVNLIAEGAEVNAEDNWGDTPLHLAAKGGHNVVADFLIAEGADVNAKGQGGRTPLHWAAEGGFKDMAAILIAKGAFVNAKDEDVNANDEQGGTPLHEAAGEGHAPVVECLIANGADVNAEGEHGTPLHEAALVGHTAIVEYLIAHGADVNAKDVYGETPLYGAVLMDDSDTADCLIAGGADVNTENDEGLTPMQLAENKGHYDMVELLKKHGAMK